VGLNGGDDGWREEEGSKSERTVGAGEVLSVEQESRDGERKLLSCAWAVLEEVEDGPVEKLVGRGESHCRSGAVMFSPNVE
jgi:hypothetical protein